MSNGPMNPEGAERTAFVLGGGGVLGATQVGMVRALLEHGVRPDLVVGTSVGALNGALIAADPTPAVVDRLTGLWESLSSSHVFSGSVFSQLGTLARYGTHLHSNDGLRRLLDGQLPGARIEQLPVAFQCVASSIERAAATWFDRGPLADAVLASCAVPGLLPAVEINGEHFLDGGLVHSIPIGRAVTLGATRIFVLHVGRVERPLTPPRWPWQVGLVAFEIARRHRYIEELATTPAGTTIHVLPSGGADTPLVSLRYRDTSQVRPRIERAYRASLTYLEQASDPRPSAGTG
jgi:NTE family protein